MNDNIDLIIHHRPPFKDAIEKWESILLRGGEDQGTRNCAFCARYYHDNGCAGCPVSTYSGYEGCESTPYVHVSPSGFVTDASSRIAAKGELDFLIMLETFYDRSEGFRDLCRENEEKKTIKRYGRTD